jgi:Xaa-Pro aminopeptidase
MLERKKKMLRDVMEKYDCDALLFTDPKNIRYFCGFKGDNCLFVCTHDHMVLITDPRFELDAKMHVKDARIVINKKESALWELPELYKELGIKRLGFSPKVLTVEIYGALSPLVQLVPVDIIPASFRYVKGPHEMKLIQKAVEIHKKSFIETLETLVDNPTEKTFAATLDHMMRLNGAETYSFDTIVAFAENSAIVHATPTDKKIKGKGFLLIDFGAVYDGYHSDETITLIMGEPTPKMIEIYDLVYTAQRRAIEAVKPGVTAVELYDKAYGYIIEKGYGKCIQHSLGHHLGLEIHEYPKIFPFTDFVFEEGMVFTIEPGLYVPDLGGVRIEDMVRVTSTGCELLTSLPKEKRVII